MDSKQLRKEFPRVRDLSEFCLEWPNLRKHLSEDEAPLENWSPKATTTLKWLVLLADKTCVLERE